MKTGFIFSILLLLIGCSSTPKEQPASSVSASGEQPVRYARAVKFAIFDSTSRPPTAKLTVLREAPNNRYHTIATLTIDGTADKEAALINALAWKARQLGADSILIMAPLHPHREEWIFRGDAIVTDAEK